MLTRRDARARGLRRFELEPLRREQGNDGHHRSRHRGHDHQPRGLEPEQPDALHPAQFPARRHPAEQHRAEQLIESTIADLHRFQSPAEAYAAGYRSIGDALTGDEHYVNWSYVNDGHILDPPRPESIVYENRDGEQHAVAAMYMLPFGSTFADVPDVGGSLTQWHVHRNLCLTNDPQQKVVAGLTSLDGGVPARHEQGRRHADAARVDRAQPVRTVRRARRHRRRTGARRSDPPVRHPQRPGALTTRLRPTAF